MIDVCCENKSVWKQKGSIPMSHLSSHVRHGCKIRIEYLRPPSGPSKVSTASLCPQDDPPGPCAMPHDPRQILVLPVPLIAPR